MTLDSGRTLDIEDNANEIVLEDFNANRAQSRKSRQVIRNKNLPKITKTSNSNGVIGNVSGNEKGVEEGGDVCGNAPGVGVVYVKTWGCAHNNSDSEYMAGLVSEYGYTVTTQDDERFDADLWLLNSCTVKSPAEMHFRNFIHEGQNRGKGVVVSGCVAQSEPNSPYLEGLSIVGVQQIDRVVEVVEETLKGHTVQLLGSKKNGGGKKQGGARLDLPKIRKNPLIEILAINTGCLNRCTYCKTKHARGELGSYPVEDLVERARVSFQEQGCKELWITSEDTGAYGLDIGSNLPQLLRSLLDVTPDDCMIRVGMTNPPYMRRYLEEIAIILNHKNFYSFLHVPVQSGSDAVLTDMKREYCKEDFCEIVDFLKAEVPGVTIATDFICGFPTETDEDFEESLELLRKYKFPSVFINQFFPRPGTPAAFMRQIPGQAIKKRTAAMSSLFKAYYPYEGRKGKIYYILVTDVSFDKKHYIGHNKCYEQVLIPMKEELMGTWVKVQIIDSSKFSMHGRIIERNVTSTILNADVSSISSKILTAMQELSCNNFSWKNLNSIVIITSLLFSISLPLLLMYRKGGFRLK